MKTATRTGWNERSKKQFEEEFGDWLNKDRGYPGLVEMNL